MNTTDMNENKMISGENYSLSEIFSGVNNKVVIPDLQRDYCWGNTENGLVDKFVSNILEMDKEQEITMGLIYGYYDKQTEEHLLLCDGQQRLTTLFLLIGILNKKSGDNRYQKLLMSDFEKNEDDHEPYLQYSIRESSLYFLSDLTYYYFLQEAKYNVEEIKNQSWYLNDYELDPTVQSIILALKTIEQCLNCIDDKDIQGIGDFLCTKLKFLFYDMGNRENGEETFVIINTTGEPLTATQNLKPLIINQEPDKEAAAKIWESMETWFWQHRDKSIKRSASDAGFYEFLRWVYMLKVYENSDLVASIALTDSGAYAFPYKDIKLDFIVECFEALKKIYMSSGIEYLWDENQPIYKPRNMADCFRLLPIIQYSIKFKDASAYEIQRVARFFLNLSRYQLITTENQSLSLAIKTIDLMTDKDIICLLDSNVSKHILTDEEKIKLNIYQQYKNDRCSIEAIFWEAEGHKMIRGKLTHIIHWSNHNSTFNITTFSEYYNKLKQCWNEEYRPLTQRALITMEDNCFPIMNSETTASWGNDSEWHDWYDKNHDFIKRFLDTIDINHIQEGVNARITNYSNKEYPLYFLAKNSELKEYCTRNLLRIIGNKHFIAVYEAVKKGQRWFIDQEELAIIDGWKQWQNYGTHILYTDHLHYNIAIDIYLELENSKYFISVFAREDNNSKPHYPQLEDYCTNKLLFTYNEKDRRYWSEALYNAKDLMERIKSICIQ